METLTWNERMSTAYDAGKEDAQQGREFCLANGGGFDQCYRDGWNQRARELVRECQRLEALRDAIAKAEKEEV